VIIYLLFLGGRGKEKLWVQILHHLSNFGVVIFNTECGRKPQNQCSIRLLAPIDNGKSFILLLISNALVSPGNEVCKRCANLFAHRQWTADVEIGSLIAEQQSLKDALDSRDFNRARELFTEANISIAEQAHCITRDLRS
jgi:hypothetical protein